MAIYLNTNKSLINFKGLCAEKYYIDKSEIISLLNEKIATTSKYICITRPRRFGKSSIADMLGAYYTGTIDSSEVFENLKISSYSNFNKNLNKYNVINISFADVDNNCKSCIEYIERITKLILDDLYEAFPEMKIKEEYAIWETLSELNEQFIFIFDEWDYIFNKNLFKEDQDKFLEFLMKLLKDKPYVVLTYMTGVFPIKKYSSGSALNMFDEYTMLQDPVYGEFFGFTEEEVKTLCERQRKITFEELSP